MCICDRLKLIPTSRRTFPLPFRYPSGVRVQLQCDSVTPLTELCYPLSILPACRQNEHFADYRGSKVAQGSKSPKSSGILPVSSGLTSLQSGIGILVCRTHVNGTMAGRLTDLLMSGLTDFCYPSGIFLVSFRSAGKVAMRFRDSLNRILAPFRYPFAILPACRQNKHFAP